MISGVATRRESFGTINRGCRFALSTAKFESSLRDAIPNPKLFSPQVAKMVVQTADKYVEAVFCARRQLRDSLCLWLLTNSGWVEIRDVSIAVAVGMIVYAATRLGRREG